MISAAEVLARSGLDARSFASDDASFVPMPSWMEATVGREAVAMTIMRTVFVRSDRYDDVLAGGEPELVAHEMIHVDQWALYGACGFLARYLRDYTILRTYGLSHRDAYRRIGFEWAAYDRSSHMVHRT